MDRFSFLINYLLASICEDHNVPISIRCSVSPDCLHQISIPHIFRAQHVMLLQLFNRGNVSRCFVQKHLIPGERLQFFQRIRDRGGKKQALFLLRQSLKDRLDLLVEMTAQQTIRLIQHQKLYPGQRERVAALQMIGQTAGRRHDYMWLLGQLEPLGHHVHSPNDDAMSEIHGFADHRELVCDLIGQFASWC